MPFSTNKNTPLTIDLVQLAKTTGWTVNDSIAIHESCNAGFIRTTGFNTIVGEEYEITYNVISISNGYVVVNLGSTTGTNRTTTGFYTETITSSGDGILSFFSDADCQIELVAIQSTQVNIATKKQNTLSFNNRIGKWSSFYSYIPDNGFSMFTDLFTFKRGQLYIHKSQSNDRNNFHGTEYQSILKFVSNKEPIQPKTFQSLNYQSNQLLITTTDGITTSLGQVSELIEVDFLKTTLIEGVTSVEVYDSEGIYSAGFWRDKNIDLINGDVLKGNYITIELTTIDNQVLKLFTVDVHSNNSPIGAR